MSNLNMIKESLSDYRGSYAGCHTRWRGLESHLLDTRFDRVTQGKVQDLGKGRGEGSGNYLILKHDALNDKFI